MQKFNLYGLLPAVVRYYDRYSSGVVGLSTDETTLQKILYAIEQEADDEDTLVDGLRNLLDAENCEEQFLWLLTRFIGVGFFGSWPIGRRRLFVRALCKLYHRSGQKACWKSLLDLMGHDKAEPIELWKEDIFEDFEYSEYGGGSGYYYQYHAARVDVKAENGSLLNSSLTDQENDLLEHFRPIHVLIRDTGMLVHDESNVINSLSGDLVEVGGTLVVEEDLCAVTDSCTSGCQAQCEVGCEAGNCEGSFEFSISCISNCELLCEIGCEAACEATGTEYELGMSVTDPGTGNPLALRMKYGSFFNEKGTVRYEGMISVLDPAVGVPLNLMVITGELYNEEGTSKYNGLIAVIYAPTGAIARLTVADGRMTL